MNMMLKKWKTGIVLKIKTLKQRGRGGDVKILANVQNIFKEQRPVTSGKLMVIFLLSG